MYFTRRVVQLSIFYPRVVQLWRQNLAKVNAKVAESLADPTEYENLFVGLSDGYRTEQFLAQERCRPRPAADYPGIPVSCTACP